MIMVKPGMPYLDIVRDTKEKVAIYNNIYKGYLAFFFCVWHTVW